MRRAPRRHCASIGSPPILSLRSVLIEGDDILGDGVNIAARLEGIAEPGGICISEDAFRQVRGKVEVEFADCGEQTLKNIARPLRVYRVGSSPAANQPISGAAALPLPHKPSIAVGAAASKERSCVGMTKGLSRA